MPYYFSRYYVKLRICDKCNPRYCASLRSGVNTIARLAIDDFVVATGSRKSASVKQAISIGVIDRVID